MTDKEFIQFSKTLPSEFFAKVIPVSEFRDVFTFLKRGINTRILRNVETLKRVQMCERAPWYLRLIGVLRVHRDVSFFNMLERQNDGLYITTPSEILFKRDFSKMKFYKRKGFCASVHNTLRKNNAVVLIELKNYTKIFLCKSTKIS